MAKITVDSGRAFPKPKAGQHEVMLVQVIDLGTQPSKDPQYEPSRQLEFMFEVMDEKAEFDNKDWTKEEKPFWLWMYASPYISYKLDKITNYHKLIRNLAGTDLTHEEAKNFNFDDYLGKIYTATVVANGDFMNIQSFVRASDKLVKAYDDYQVFNPKFVFSLEEFDKTIYNTFNEKKKLKIANSPEYQKLMDWGNRDEEPAGMPREDWSSNEELEETQS